MCRIKTRGTKLTNGVRVETRDNLKDYFYAVLEDNDANQRLIGFQDENLMELYQQSIEAISLMQRVSLALYQFVVAT